MTLERRVAASYLVHMLAGTSGQGHDGLRIVRVAFQLSGPVDDLAVDADRGEAALLRSMRVAVRRAPSFQASDLSSRQLVEDLVAAQRAMPDGQVTERRLAVCVAGRRSAAEQVRSLAAHARVHSEAATFFALFHEPQRFRQVLVNRLTHLVALVRGCSFDDALGVVDETTWRLLSTLEVLMPRYEDPDTSDWVELANHLIPLTRTHDVGEASVLRDRIEALAGTYAPMAAVVDRAMLVRDLGLSATGAWSPNPARLDSSRERRIAAERAMALSLARSAERVESLGLDAAGREIVLDHVAAAAPEALHSPVSGTLTVVTGRLGSGKTELGEWWHRRCLHRIVEGTSARHALWFSAKQDTDIAAKLTAAADDGDVDAVIDGLDEMAVADAADLLEQLRVLLRVKPNTQIVVTARPGLATGRSDRQIDVAPLAMAETVALYEELTSRSGGHLYGWPEAARNALRWPLWVVLAATLRSDRPGSEAELLDGLVTAALARSRERRLTESPATFQQLTRLAVTAVRNRGSVPVGEAGGFGARQVLTATGLVADDGHRLAFTLPIIEQWLAARAVVVGEVPVAELTATATVVARWRYPMAVALATGPRAVVDALMSSLTALNIGLGNWVVDAVAGNFDARGDDVDEELLGSRLSDALTRVDQASRSGSGLAVLPVGIDGGRATVGIGVESGRLTVVFAPGGRCHGGFELLNRRPTPEPGWGFRAGPLDDRACGVWLFAYELLRDRVKGFLEGGVGFRDGCGELFAAEQRWAMCVALAPAHARLTGRADPAQVIEKCDELIALAEHDVDDDAVFPVGSLDIPLGQLRALRTQLVDTPELASAPSPAPDLKPIGGRVWMLYSPERLLELAQWTYGAALTIYRDLVAAWFPGLQGVLGKSCVRALEITATLIVGPGPDLADGPRLSYGVGPAPADTVGDRVRVTMGSGALEIGQWRDTEPFVRQIDEWRRLHRDVAEFGRFSRAVTMLEVLTERPATKIALKWIADDLKGLGFGWIQPKL